MSNNYKENKCTKRKNFFHFLRVEFSKNGIRFFDRDIEYPGILIFRSIQKIAVMIKGSFLRVVSVRILRNDFYGIFSDFFVTNLLCNPGICKLIGMKNYDIVYLLY